MLKRNQISNLIYEIKKELDYIEEDLLYCYKKFPYTTKFYTKNFSVRITINQIGEKDEGFY